ncbi:MAG: hypothetical protein IJ368_02100 [Oscillospiraceae bacterium]|nr:hypothetical protein [Oscillospiraceae bacterium]
MKRTISKIAALMLTASIAVSSIGTTVSAYYDTAVVNDYTAAAKNDDASDNETTSKNFNNSSYYTKLDKWGKAYPYMYYKYAHNYYAREAFEKIYNAVHECEKSVTLTKEEYEGIKAVYKDGIVSFVIAMRRNCTDIYYIKKVKGKIIEDGGVELTFNYTLSKEKIEKNNKKIAEAVADFDAYLEERCVVTTEDFLQATLDYLGETVFYDYADISNRTELTDNDTIVGPFTKRKAVCGGYTQAFNHLCATHGIPYAPFLTKGVNIGGTHAVSMVPVNNVWLVFDATWFDSADHQFVTEEQFKKDAQYKFARYKQRGDERINPVSDGNELPVTIALEAPKSEETTDTETSAQAEKPKSDTKSVKLKDSHLKSFKTFKSVYAKYYKIVKESEMTSLKITVPEDKVSTAVKYIQKMKKDGDYSYSKIYKGENYVKIVL